MRHPITPKSPVLSSYDSEHLHRISLPVGGIGTGTIGLGGRGQLRDFELGNRPATGFRPKQAFFAIRVQQGETVTTRVLEGPLDDAEFDGDDGSPAANQGLPRFRSARFETGYPFATVELTDPAMPDVSLDVFNPFIPAALDASSLPVALLRYRVRNDSAESMKVSIAAAFENFVGANGTVNDIGGNRNEYVEEDDLAGVLMTAPDLPQGHEASGTFCFATVRAGGEISHRLGWADAFWSDSYLEFWDDFVDDGLLADHETSAERPVGSLTNETTIAPGGSGEIVFVLSWNFPNRRAWRSDGLDGDISHAQYTDEIVGNHYSVVHPDPWQAARSFVADRDILEERSRRSVGAIIGSNVPHSLREAALFNLSTLRSPTLFRTADGNFYGWEGVRDRQGSCFGTCTHVWGYEFATSLLFSEIAVSFRETQYLRSTDDRGMMRFRASLPAESSDRWQLAAADGQMATFIHLYFDFVLSGDIEMLRRLWPAAKKSLEFAWIAGGWDADMDGVMEGCQHNTMDVEYYGPNPQMQSWYLGALRAGAELGETMDDDDFAATCKRLFESGSRWTDENLFNGRYYEQQIRPIENESDIAEGLRQLPGRGKPSNPVMQLGEGVLIDQLVGQYAARLTGLGDVLEPANVRTTIDHVYASNHRDTMWGHFNHMRGYALEDDSAVLMASYEPNRRPKEPFPYFNEVMTGFEYTLAVNHIQDGNRDTAVAIIDAVRRRYDGRRRNPFDETECGRHYARAMASWSALVAWNDVNWDARKGRLSTSLAEGSTFFSTGSACGEIRRTADGAIEVEVFEGEIALAELVVEGKPFGSQSSDGAVSMWRAAQ
jgi:non-lysosomal glucosylceramidase